MTLIKEYFTIFKHKFWSILILSIAVVGYALIMHYCFPTVPACMVKAITGIPCPMCGITRAYLYFFKLDFKNAFYYHPLFWLLPFILWMIIFRERPLWNKLIHSKIFWTIFFVIYIGVYILRFIYVYPNSPMDITKGLINRLIIK